MRSPATPPSCGRCSPRWRAWTRSRSCSGCSARRRCWCWRSARSARRPPRSTAPKAASRPGATPRPPPRTKRTTATASPGGLLGLFEFRFTLRLTQALNHLYRSRVFERIQSLPMRAFDDERIGDAVYRLMYDTPSITNVCYRLLVTPVAAVLGLLVTVWVVREHGDRQPGRRLGRARLPAARPAHDAGLRSARPRAVARQPRSRRDHHHGDRGGLREHPGGPEPRQRGPRAPALRARELGLLRRLPPLRAHDHPRDRLRRGAGRRADGLRLPPRHRPRDRRRPHARATSRWSSPTTSRSRATRSRSARSGSRSRAPPPGSAASSS